MADNPLTCEVMGNYGHPDHLKLDNILDPPDPDEDEIHIMRLSHYFPIEELPKPGLAKIPTCCCYNWAALHVFSQGKQCSSHGGLITYINTNINVSVMNIEITSPIWEGLFVKIQGMENTKDIIIGNIYRKPYDNNCKENI